MKHIKLFENFNNFNSLNLEDVIGSVDEYIYKTYTASIDDTTSPYGCESKYFLEQLLEYDGYAEEYDIDLSDSDYWKSKEFKNMMCDKNCIISIAHRFENIKFKLSNLNNTKLIKIYRCISANEKYINSFLNGEIKKLGKYWSYLIDDIGAPDSKNIDKLLLFCGLIDSNFVNWKETILFNLNYHIGDTESEIILDKTSEIILTDVLIANEYNPKKITDFKRFPLNNYIKLDIEHLKNSIFFL
jgi:hypothetical protein